MDRPLLGMRLLGAEHGLSHPLFDDPVFVKSKSWVMSTSHLGADCTSVRPPYCARMSMSRLPIVRCFIATATVTAIGGIVISDRR